MAATSSVSIEVKPSFKGVIEALHGLADSFSDLADQINATADGLEQVDD